jgi:hypothetical protein
MFNPTKSLRVCSTLMSSGFCLNYFLSFLLPSLYEQPFLKAFVYPRIFEEKNISSYLGLHFEQIKNEFCNAFNKDTTVIRIRKFRLGLSNLGRKT